MWDFSGFTYQINDRVYKFDSELNQWVDQNGEYADTEDREGMEESILQDDYAGYVKWISKVENPTEPFDTTIDF